MLKYPNWAGPVSDQVWNLGQFQIVNLSFGVVIWVFEETLKRWQPWAALRAAYTSLELVRVG